MPLRTACSLLLVVGLLAGAASASPVIYSSYSLVGSNYRYEYTVYNEEPTDGNVHTIFALFEAVECETIPSLPPSDDWDWMGGVGYAEWVAAEGIAPGATLSGFSFETSAEYGPMWTTFELWTNDSEEPYYVQAWAPAPEPISLVFYGTGIAAVLAFVARKRMK